MLDQKITAIEKMLAVKNKGSIKIRACTTLSTNIDAVRVQYHGMTALELTSREIGPPAYLHSSFGMFDSGYFPIVADLLLCLADMAVSAAGYPGNKFLDADCETSACYSSKLPGTVSISGYSEEYRAQQLRTTPPLKLTLESRTVLPEIRLSTIVERLRKLKFSPFWEDSEGLSSILGLSL